MRHEIKNNNGVACKMANINTLLPHGDFKPHMDATHNFEVLARETTCATIQCVDCGYMQLVPNGALNRMIKKAMEK